MKIETIIIVILILAALIGISWSVFSMIGNNTNQTVDKNSDNYQQALSAELDDKCKTPDGYTDEAWQEHMSHHPERYKECFQNKTTVIQKLQPAELNSMMQNKDFTLIDVHMPEQVHIPGTDSLIPYNEISQRVSELPKDKSAKIVLYCRSGSMSAAAAKTLQAMGYENIYDLAGGMNAWQRAGFDSDDSSLIK